MLLSAAFPISLFSLFLILSLIKLANLYYICMITFHITFNFLKYILSLHCYQSSPLVEWDPPWLLPSSASGSQRPVSPTESSRRSCLLREPERTATTSASQSKETEQCVRNDEIWIQWGPKVWDHNENLRYFNVNLEIIIKFEDSERLKKQ